MTRERSLRALAPTLLAILLSFVALAAVMDAAVFLACAVAGVGSGLCGVLAAHMGRWRGAPRPVTIGLSAVLFFGPPAVLVTTRGWAWASPIAVTLVVALSLVFCYYSVFVPAAVYDAYSREPIEATAPYPSLTVLVPAYDEEGYVGACVDSVLAADYPRDRVEVIVIDDGSEDGTYAEATTRADDDRLKVVRKRNGGKHSALNYGLRYAAGEIVVTVDADCVIEPGALSTMAGAFQREPELGALAGRVEVRNRSSFLTAVQALEYVVSIQIARRAFDLYRGVPVVPGALGAFRASVLRREDYYDPDTLTEDFDLTVKVLKDDRPVRASEATCGTLAPTTWGDLYRQRLRWYRGNLMTLMKHREVFRDPAFGTLHAFTFPLFLVTMVVVPAAGFVVVAAVLLGLFFGETLTLLAILAFFVLLQTFVSVLALQLDRSGPRLAVYAPFFIVGYRQFLDAVMVKSAVDVLVGRELEWTSPARTGSLDEPARDGVVADTASPGRSNWGSGSEPRPDPGPVDSTE